uniref:Uncharacterized protein n=1 Tax=Panagrolaimus superbus TaxID=310955 RepID=A0A914YFK3_9BILA
MATRAALNPSALEEQIQQRINAMQNGKLRRDSHPRTPLTTTNPAAMPLPSTSTTSELNQNQADVDGNDKSSNNNNNNPVEEEEVQQQQPSTSGESPAQDINIPEDDKNIKN